MVAVICLDNCYVSFINLFVNRYEKRLFLLVRQFFFVPDQLNKYIILKYIILPVHCFCVFQTLTPGDSSPPCMTFMVAAKDKGDGLWLVANVLQQQHITFGRSGRLPGTSGYSSDRHITRCVKGWTGHDPEIYYSDTPLSCTYVISHPREVANRQPPPPPIKQELIVFPQGSPSAARKYVLHVAHTFL
jgi:hypothetical protein